MGRLQSVDFDPPAQFIYFEPGQVQGDLRIVKGGVCHQAPSRFNTWIIALNGSINEYGVDD